MRGMAVWFLLFALPLMCQRFPMKYLGELGHLSPGQRSGPARAVEEGVVELTGKGWSVRFGVTGGVGWSELYTADFDADGQQDFLIGEHFPGCGQCISFTNVTVLLFDKAGRPVPWHFGTYLPDDPLLKNAQFPYLPVWVIDADRDGRAEFVVTDCKRDRGDGMSGVYAARDGRLTLRRDEAHMATYRRITGLSESRPWVAEELLPGYGEPFEGRIEELLGDGVGVEDGQKIRIAGRSSANWPSMAIIESPDSRSIKMEGGWDALMHAIRNGFPVRRLGDSGWIVVDATAPVVRANAVVEFDIAGISRARAVTEREEDGCIVLRLSNSSRRRCGNSWNRNSGGTIEQLLPDGVTIRTSHTAMHHTVTGETRYERPPGATRMTGMAEIGDFEITQWGPNFFALHSGRGQLIASGVRLDAPGELVDAAADGLLMLQGNQLVTLRGRLRWRRE